MLRAVGLIGDGDTGERIGATGESRDSDGLAGWFAVEMLSESFGLTPLAASILKLDF